MGLALPLQSGVDKKKLLDDVRGALYASKICSYAQGLNIIRAKSIAKNWGIDMGSLTRIWKVGGTAQGFRGGGGGGGASHVSERPISRRLARRHVDGGPFRFPLCCSAQATADGCFHLEACKQHPCQSLPLSSQPTIQTREAACLAHIMCAQAHHIAASLSGLRWRCTVSAQSSDLCVG